MPSAAKKSPAYEKGIREGRADKSKPSVEIEISSEGEEEENEMEGEEMDAAKTNRKRSAKGAKHTKAPMDGEGCSCMSKGRKGKCDGNCGKKMDRNDALTPQEYLAACDLGIQGRSRTYIRARLDAAERLDLKCGNGAISEGEKCTKGAATKVETALKVGGTIGAVGSLAAGVYQAGKGNYKRAHQAFAASHGFSALAATGTALQGKRTGNKAMQKAGEFSVGLNAALAGANIGVTQSKLYTSRGGGARATQKAQGTPVAGPQEEVQRVRVREIPNVQPRLTGSTIQEVKVREISSIPLQYEGRSTTQERRVAQQALAGYKRRSETTRSRIGVSRAPRVTGTELGLNGSDYFGRSTEYGVMGIPTERIRTPRRRSSRQSTTKDTAFAPGFNIDWEAIAL